ncbi:MAG TPA: hypothetical protein VHA82_11200 [Ramlibacter sp.]|uniref:hypothetical protein n=1 Tax=Ramlibacter sp. TaxID=1917967 RepID=UPI002BF14A4C|nr:hypothetical protein [Ramlibacter sp.]HVZ44367.1 hypothetical protein [Ramlibacter sp.]
MILDDKRVALRLSAHPELLLRLDEFRQSYGWETALVAQAAPAQPLRLDVTLPAVEQALLNGAARRPAWWDGLRAASRPRATLHGIASLPLWTNPPWACEAHRDGHFIAGVARFPEMPGSGGVHVRCIADFHASFFQDFFEVVSATLNAAGVKDASYDTTWTLINAPALHYGNKPDSGASYCAAAGPLMLANLQAPVIRADVGSSAWDWAAIDMGRALCGAYGGTPAYL